jgi:pimeloyl-ACP methyl ester carboxylesterase
MGVCGLLALIAVGFGSAVFAASPHSDDAASAEAILQQASASAAGECNPYRVRHWLRERIVHEHDLANYGLRLEDDGRGRSANQPVVVLLHGFNATRATNGALLTPIRAADIPCGTFAYPNDHDIATSAQSLSSELRKFAKRYPGRPVMLIGHSMGGIVARACIENPSYDPGNVDRLIMIAPPNQGSLIAHFAVGTDLWEHWLARRSGGPWTRMRESIVDGLGEAADELCTESKFLKELNARPRHPRVRYSIILGTGAMMSEAQLAWIRESVRECLAKLPAVDDDAARLDAIFSDIDELVEGKGDGVVAVKRGRLQGVSDTLVLPFGHLAVTGEAKNRSLESVHEAVLQRLR